MRTQWRLLTLEAPGVFEKTTRFRHMFLRRSVGAPRGHAVQAGAPRSADRDVKSGTPLGTVPGALRRHPTAGG